MRPMDAWRIISKNMVEIYHMRRTSEYKGYTEDEVEAEVICMQALQLLEKKQELDGKKRNIPLNEMQRKLVKAMAAESMNVSNAAKRIGYTGAGASYALNKIKKLTALDPRNFYDLRELMELIEDGVDNG